jgi:hypothetical protein
MNYKQNAVIGSYILRDEKNGCLTSLYFNEPGNGTFVESCKLYRKIGSEKFEGIYYTSLHEDKGKIESCILEITAIKNTNLLYDYKLEWKELNKPNALIFYSEAFLYGEILVGAYWSV